MSKSEEKKYYSDFEPLLKNQPTQKLKLEFSILHANEGNYMIQAKLF